MGVTAFAALASGAALAYSLGDLLLGHLREQRRELVIARKMQLLDAYRRLEDIEGKPQFSEVEHQRLKEEYLRAEAEYQAFTSERPREQQAAS